MVHDEIFGYYRRARVPPLKHSFPVHSSNGAGR
jgi:hypothetical protein